MNRLVSILLIIAVVLSGCVGQPTTKVETINTTETTTETTTTTSKPALSIVSGKGSLINAEKIILDDADKGPVPEGKITLEGISKGEHQVIIIVNGVKYSKPFSFTGGSISLQLEDPISVKVSVWSKTVNKPLEGVKVYIDEEGVKCTTNLEGICSFSVSPEKHVFKLEGNGVFHEETKTVTKDSSSFTFKVERKLLIKVTVTDDLSNFISNAQVSLDGSPKGLTKQDGTLDLLDVTEGAHVIEISYQDLTEKVSANAGDSVKVVLKIPKNIEIKILDKSTNNPVSGISIYLDNLNKGETNIDGIIKISDIKQGIHSVGIKYKQLIDKSESITVSTSKLNFPFTIDAPRTFTLIVKDNETSKAVSSEKIYLNGQEKGTTAQDGTLKLTDILPDSYRITVGTIDASNIQVLSQSEITTTVDMPNPIIQPSGTYLWTDLFHTNLKCQVSLSNTGNDIANNPLALCIVYEISSDGKTKTRLGVSSKLFTNIAGGGTSSPQTTEETVPVPPNPFTKEEIVIVVYVNHPYLKSQQQSLTIQTSQSFVSQVLQDTYNYCSSNLGKCAEIAGTFVGSLLK